MSKLYAIMKDGQKIKTARSLNVAKELADQEQAEVFCDGEKIYAPVSKGPSIGQPITEETHAATSDDTAKPETSDAEKQSEKPIEPLEPIEPTKPTDTEQSAKAEESKEAADTEKPTESAKSTEPVKPAKSDVKPIEQKFSVYRLKSLMNVREAPSLNAKCLRTAPKGTLIQVIAIDNDWLKIRDGSNFAYILYKNGEFAEKVTDANK